MKPSQVLFRSMFQQYLQSDPVLREEIEYQKFLAHGNLKFWKNITSKSLLTFESQKEVTFGQNLPIGSGRNTPEIIRPASSILLRSESKPEVTCLPTREEFSKPETIFIARDKNDHHHHVDQLGKYEIEKIDYIPPPPIEEGFLRFQISACSMAPSTAIDG